jgi:2-polyprenyl-6-methoxyphenol hydroxylase-like FAD-dependent oxidoreductase
MRDKSEPEYTTDVLIVGAGPTGLALCAQLLLFGVRSRIVDRALDRAHESRALAVQARTLELFQAIDVADELVSRGNKSAKLMLHLDGRVVAEAQLAGFAAIDTRFPFVLFVSQAETEALLGEHLASKGVMIERGVELMDFVADMDGVECVLSGGDGVQERVRAQYLVGCDGAHSTVRKGAGIPFEGDAYLLDFMLGDIEAEAEPGVRLQANTLHSFTGRDGIAMFFPLGQPTTWRVIAMSGDPTKQIGNSGGTEDKPNAVDLSLTELQRVVDGATGGVVRLRDPAWLTHFRLHHRQAARYRNGRVFLAGDAGHIHSPVGGQGMNTGIQDAWNLGWKLAFVLSGAAHSKLLESYEAERWPVGRALLQYTDWIFSVFVRSLSRKPFVVWLRRSVVSRVLPGILNSKRLGSFAFYFISEFSIHYRKSDLVTEGVPRLRSGPRAGDRLPDVKLTRDGQSTYLQKELCEPSFHLLLCGRSEGWDANDTAELATRYHDDLKLHYLSRNPDANVLVDSGEALATLGVRDMGQYLVRPDGYVAYRCEGPDLRGVQQYLASWLVNRPEVAG